MQATKTQSLEALLIQSQSALRLALGTTSPAPADMQSIQDTEAALSDYLSGMPAMDDAQVEKYRRSRVFTDAELNEMLRQMSETISAFYSAAVRIGNHPFIEFAGVMGEYVRACEIAAERGVDFTQCNTHGALSLPLSPHMRAYIAEKLECIFSGHPELVRCPEPRTAGDVTARALQQMAQDAEPTMDADAEDDQEEGVFVPVQLEKFRQHLLQAAERFASMPA